jgi:hypothetical protein
VTGEIVEQYFKGMTLQQIADQLNERGVKTAQGGRQWWPMTVKKILERKGVQLRRAGRPSKETTR